MHLSSGLCAGRARKSLRYIQQHSIGGHDWIPARYSAAGYRHRTYQVPPSNRLPLVPYCVLVEHPKAPTSFTANQLSREGSRLWERGLPEAGQPSRDPFTLLSRIHLFSFSFLFSVRIGIMTSTEGSTVTIGREYFNTLLRRYVTTHDPCGRLAPPSRS